MMAGRLPKSVAGWRAHSSPPPRSCLRWRGLSRDSRIPRYLLSACARARSLASRVLRGFGAHRDGVSASSGSPAAVQPDPSWGRGGVVPRPASRRSTRGSSISPKRTEGDLSALSIAENTALRPSTALAAFCTSATARCGGVERLAGQMKAKFNSPQGPESQAFRAATSRKFIIDRWLMRDAPCADHGRATRSIDVNPSSRSRAVLRRLTEERGPVHRHHLLEEMEELLDVANRIMVMHERHLQRHGEPARRPP